MGVWACPSGRLERWLRVARGSLGQKGQFGRSHRPRGIAQDLLRYLFEDDDNVSFLVSGLRMPVSLGDLLQGIASFDHGP